MHDLQFALAARPARFIILGLPMLPYSIGHEIQLLSRENPLLFSGFESLSRFQQNVAIRCAVLVCCRGWRESFKAHRWLRLWRWATGRADYRLAVADWLNYRRQGSAFPNAPTAEAVTISGGKDEEGGRALGSPHLARLINFLSALPERQIRELTTETVFDIPLGLANYLYAEAAESDGRLKVENAREMEIRLEMEEHRKFFAAKAKEAKCQPS